jgi:hypothetical protein
MRVKFTKHSLEQIERRRISKKLIKRFINNFNANDSIKAENIIKIINKVSKSKLLIIICIFTPTECRIVTAYLTSKIKKYLTE